MKQFTFADNKYTRWYDSIIEYRRCNLAVGYTERHHVMPKSLGGSNDPQNIVRLTAREHFVCHRLLVKMTIGLGDAHRRMVFALHRMMHGTNADMYRPSSRDYAVMSELNAEAARQMQLERFSDPETHARQVALARQASAIAAEKNRGNVAFCAAQSRRVQKLVHEGRHNFLGGEIQRESWKDPERRAKSIERVRDRVRNGTHLFQDEQFIEQQRVRLKSHWANMTPEQREEHGRRISEGRLAGAQHRRQAKQS